MPSLSTTWPRSNSKIKQTADQGEEQHGVLEAEAEANSNFHVQVFPQNGNVLALVSEQKSRFNRVGLGLERMACTSKYTQCRRLRDDRNTHVVS